MTMSSSPLAYKAEYDLMDRALKAAKGVRVPFKTRPEASTYRLKLNNARKLQRKLNKELYTEGHVLHGCSEYDELVFVLREDADEEWWVYLEKQLVPEAVEEI